MLKFKILIREVNRMIPRVWEWAILLNSQLFQSATVDSIVRRWLITLGRDFWHKFLLPAVYALAVENLLWLKLCIKEIIGFGFVYFLNVRTARK